MSNQALLLGYGWKPIVSGGAVFDGTNDYMTRGAGLTGAADSKSGILSFWINPNEGGFISKNILWSDTVLGGSVNFRFACLINGGAPSNIFINARNSAATIILNISTAANPYANGTWGHFLCSWDLAAGASHMYANDVSDQSVTTRTNDTIDYTVADWAIGASPGGASKLNSSLAEFYFAPGQFLDFSVVTNRRKFITATGKPANLGSDGSTPTGTAPLVYQSIAGGTAVSGFATNKATGGNFTITGTLTAPSTWPSG